MENNRDQMDEKNNGTITSTQKMHKSVLSHQKDLILKTLIGEMLRKEDKKKNSHILWQE